MAAVVRLALRDIAPVVSLYVNEHNVAARAAYARAGFEQTGHLLHDHVLRLLPRPTWSCQFGSEAKVEVLPPRGARSSEEST